MNGFDAIAEVKRLKEQTQTIRKTRYKRSRLDRYKFELKGLNNNGATGAEIQRWLRDKHIKVDLSTVSRWIKKNG
jgi:hypothetical protein